MSFYKTYEEVCAEFKLKQELLDSMAAWLFYIRLNDREIKGLQETNHRYFQEIIDFQKRYLEIGGKPEDWAHLFKNGPVESFKGD